MRQGWNLITMKTTKPKKLISFALFFFVACFYLGATPAFSISLEEESIAGKKFLESMRRQFTFVDDDFANDYINKLGRYLIRPLETKYFPFHFYIIKNNELNAFAGPGGYIFVFSGMVDAMDSADELAGVLCHEIGHVSARHLAKRIEQYKKIALATIVGMLAGALLGGKPGSAIATGSVAAGIQKQLSYSREDERQADELGFKYLDASGFNPEGMVDILKKLQKREWLGGSNVPPYLLTHPGGAERISNIEIMMRHYVPRSENRQTAKFRKDFPLLKTILRAKCMDPDEAKRLFSLDLQKDPGSPLAHFGLGIIWKQRAEYGKAIDNFKKALLTKPTCLPILRELGEAYQLQGEDQDAIQVLRKALEVDAQDKGTLFLLGTSYQNLEQYDKAIRIYERLISMKPVKNEVYYNLGLSYGRQGKLALAHYYFGIYFKRQGERAKARFHFEKAQELAGNDQSLKMRIRSQMKKTRSRP